MDKVLYPHSYLTPPPPPTLLPDVCSMEKQQEVGGAWKLAFISTSSYTMVGVRNCVLTKYKILHYGWSP